MKVLFLIPKEKAPRLEGNQYSRELKDFVSLCLQKEPEKRPTAKALLKHSFIRRAGKTESLQELVQKAKAFENGGTRERDVRYYEETLRDVNLEDVEDEWVFSTIRPSAPGGSSVGRVAALRVASTSIPWWSVCTRRRIRRGRTDWRASSDTAQVTEFSGIVSAFSQRVGRT